MVFNRCYEACETVSVFKTKPNTNMANLHRELFVMVFLVGGKKNFQGTFIDQLFLECICNIMFSKWLNRNTNKIR